MIKWRHTTNRSNNLPKHLCFSKQMVLLINATLKLQIFLRADRKCFLLAHCQCPIMCHCAKVYVSLLDFSVSKPYIFNWVKLESLETINNLCTLHFLSKPDSSLSVLKMVKSHKKECQNYVRRTNSPVAKM